MTSFESGFLIGPNIWTTCSVMRHYLMMVSVASVAGTMPYSVVQTVLEDLCIVRSVAYSCIGCCHSTAFSAGMVVISKRQLCMQWGMFSALVTEESPAHTTVVKMSNGWM